MDKIELKNLLNEKMGVMYQLMLADNPQAANEIMDQLVDQIFEEFN